MDAQMFSARVFELVKQVHTKLLFTVIKAYEPYELTPPQAEVLISLSKKGSVKVSELGCKMRTADSNVSAICSRLEERGFITRERDKDDRRIVYITATPKAHALFETLKGKKAELLNLSVEKEADKEEIIQALEKLAGLLELSCHCTTNSEE